MELSVREMIPQDIAKVVDYFLDADVVFLKRMGADKSKFPSRELWIQNCQAELNKDLNKKNYYYMIWCINAIPIGHSNINHIEFGDSATMHLHLWQNVKRKKGLGLEFLKLTIPYYFNKLQLKKLICEPYSKNIAPNKTLLKYGFKHIRTYETTPGPINFFQSVCRYELSVEEFTLLQNKYQKNI